MIRFCAGKVWLLVASAVVLISLGGIACADDMLLSTPYGSATLFVFHTHSPDDCTGPHADARSCQDFVNSIMGPHSKDKGAVIAWYARQLCDRLGNIPACIRDIADNFRLNPDVPPQVQDVLNLGVSKCNPIVVDLPDTVGVSMGLACHELGDFYIRHGQERLGDALEVNGCNVSPSSAGFLDKASCLYAGAQPEINERLAAADQAKTDAANAVIAQRSADAAATAIAVTAAAAKGETWLDCSASNFGESNHETYLFKDNALSAYSGGALYPIGGQVQPNFIYFDEVNAGSALLWHKSIDRTNLGYTAAHDARVALMNPDGSYLLSSAGEVTYSSYTVQLVGTCTRIGAQEIKQKIF